MRFKDNVKSKSHVGDGQLTIQSSSEGGQLTAELPGSAFYTGTQQSAKDVDCVLLWDEEAGGYVLHRLASFSRLTKVKTAPAALKVNPLPAAAAPAVSRTLSSANRQAPPASLPLKAAALHNGPLRGSAPNTPTLASTPNSPHNLSLPQRQNHMRTNSASSVPTLSIKPKHIVSETESESDSGGSDSSSSDGDDFADLAADLEQSASAVNTPTLPSTGGVRPKAPGVRR